ncbi:MAG: hypothetical protein H8K06_20560 [Nitrospira sp.]|uniref:Secreted protein n=1 Tax=Nitrospira defluvii TaxID=330214 RepID=A0ABM8QTT7_9BACT|nr:hypothetical protein [Nitrospira defluvii]MCS6329448.1 hypothetical protein [Nitrospira sp.]CAE6715109.1 conserved hypothetical protein [Nitrospira defluvii]
MLLVCLAVAVGDAAPASTPPADEPDGELLDFLGSWQDEQGRWIDPFTSTDDHAALPHAEPKPNLNGMPAETRKPAQEPSPTSGKDRSRDPLSMETGP